MKKLILILPLILVIFAVNGQNPRKDKRKAQKAQADQVVNTQSQSSAVQRATEDDGSTSLSQVASVNHRGIYNAKVEKDFHPVKIGDDLYFSVASSEAYREGQVVVGFGIGLVRSDFVTFQRTGAPAAQLITGESTENENMAMNFIAYDPNVMDHLTNLYNDEKPEYIYLYGIPVTQTEASILRNQDDSLGVIGGEGVPTYVLVGFSSTLVQNPGVILVYSTILRDADKTIKEFKEGISFEAKVQMIGKKELEERTFVPESMVEWLYKQGLLVTRWVKSLDNKSGRRTSGQGGIELKDGGSLTSLRGGSR